MIANGSGDDDNGDDSDNNNSSKERTSDESWTSSSSEKQNPKKKRKVKTEGATSQIAVQSGRNNDGAVGTGRGRGGTWRGGGRGIDSVAAAERVSLRAVITSCFLTWFVL